MQHNKTSATAAEIVIIYVVQQVRLSYNQIILIITAFEKITWPMFILLTEGDDEMAIGWNLSGDMEFELRRHVHLLPYSDHSKELYGEMNSLWLNWRKHCFTWRSGGQFRVSLYLAIAP